MVRSWRARPIGWRNESHRHYLAAKGISTKRYFLKKESTKIEKQKLPEFLLMYNLTGVKRPRLKDAYYIRRSGDSNVPDTRSLELIRPGDKVTITLAKKKQDLLLDVVAVDSWADHQVGSVANINDAYPLGTKILFRRKNVVRLG